MIDNSLFISSLLKMSAEGGENDRYLGTSVSRQFGEHIKPLDSFCFANSFP